MYPRKRVEPEVETLVAELVFKEAMPVPAAVVEPPQAELVFVGADSNAASKVNGSSLLRSLEPPAVVTAAPAVAAAAPAVAAAAPAAVATAPPAAPAAVLCWQRGPYARPVSLALDEAFVRGM
jgi:hypothetical protein